MKVKVFPPAGCDRSMLDEKSWMELPDGASVSDALRAIGCSRVKAKLMLVSVNGEKAPLNRNLREGDVLGFFLPVSGG